MAMSSSSGSGGGGTSFVAHEWGTFTSVQSTVGESMTGLAHEDEPLPNFVYGRKDYVGGSCKGCASTLTFPPTGVTQKLDNTIVHFYGATGDVNVKLAFPKGVLSQWYPNAASFSPAVDATKAWTPAAGAMSFLATFDPSIKLTDLPPVAASDFWAPPRAVSSLPVRVKDDTERFVFYRGLATFDAPLQITSKSSDTISVTNKLSAALEHVILIRVHRPNGTLMGTAKTVSLGSKATDIVLPYGGKEMPTEFYKNQAIPQLTSMLMFNGLTMEEAKAFAESWDKSYFEMEGVRLLFTVPRTWIDAQLPLEVSPTPKELVRTVVARIEVLTPDRETAAVDKVKAYANKTETSQKVVTSLGRFAEPLLRRAEQLVKNDAALATACAELIAVAVKAP
jgi:hypothetical protein